jgi:hypothetical protein
VTELLGYAALLGFILCCCTLSAMQAYDRGYREGQDDAFRWLVDFESQVDEARQQIWREEEKKGEWL